MAFLKVERKPSGTYLRILESYRNEQGKPTSRVLYSLGKAEDYTPTQLRRMGIQLYELGGGEVKALLTGQIEELARYNYGFAQVYKRVFSHYGLDVLLRRIARKQKLEFDLGNAVLLMLLERLQEPSSKRSNWLNQQEYAGVDSVSLHHLYRALDRLAANERLIQERIFQTGRDMFSQRLDVVFYDVTTLYFESEVEQEGALRQKGFSKDGKIGRTQILFCLMIDQDKNPIGYRIFKGDTFEGHTFGQALCDLKAHYQIDKVIVVADRGMLSRKNIDLTCENGFEFIVGERLKALPRSVQSALLDHSAFQHEWVYSDHTGEEIKLRYKVISHQGRKIIATYSAKRAAKDKSDREERLQTAQKLLQQPSLIDKKAGRFFLQKQGVGSYALDQEKIARSERYDGLLAISTNNTTLSVPAVLEQYKQLYKIEHSFRTFKSHLETRPMFHWTDKRIQGHICLCYIAFTLQNYVLQKINQSQVKLTENELRKTLERMQVSLLQHNQEQVCIRSKPQGKEAVLQQKLGLKQLPPILPQTQLANYL